MEMSVDGLESPPGLVDYGASEGAINAFTRSLAPMLADKGIRANVVAPGPVWTPLSSADEGQTADKVPNSASRFR
jgi:NAD(P)-dependent dehydrogenase (short-subunit alcohol dehydrogenase family)